MRLLAQAAVFTMRYFYRYINNAVTSLVNNFSITQYTRWLKYRRFMINIS